MLPLYSFSQEIFNLKAYEYSIRLRVNDVQWAEWSEWTPIDVNIVINPKKEKVTIYLKQKEVYRIDSASESYFDFDGDPTLDIFCFDRKNVYCRLRFVRLDSVDGRNQLYVDYDNLMIVYNLYVLK